MTEIRCCKSKCLNNKKGICTAKVIEYDGLCQTYIAHGGAIYVIMAYVLDRMAN